MLPLQPQGFAAPYSKVVEHSQEQSLIILPDCFQHPDRFLRSQGPALYFLLGKNVRRLTEIAIDSSLPLCNNLIAGKFPRVPALRSRVLKQLVKFARSRDEAASMAASGVSGGYSMEIFVYSDESGVFDCYHSQYFVFWRIGILGQPGHGIRSETVSLR